MARNAINILLRLVGGKEMEAELEKLGKSGETAFREINDAANRVNFAKFGGAVNKVGADIATVARRAAIGFAAVQAAVTAAAPVIMLLARSGANAAEEAAKAAQATGLQVQSYQKLVFAAEAAGTSQEQFGQAMSRFSREIVATADKTAKAGGAIGRNIKQGIGFTTEAFDQAGVSVTRFGDKVAGTAGKANKGASDTRTAFQLLGIAIRNADGSLKTNEQLLRAVADAFSKMPDGARKSALAVRLFGQAGAKLIPLLNQGAKGFDEWGRKAEEMGILFSDDQIKAAQAFNDSVLELKKSLASVLRQVGLIFAPAITTGARAFRDIITRNRKALLDFVNDVVKRATVLIKDFFAALTGRDTDVSNRWIIEWRDAIVQFGSDFMAVVNGVIVPSFNLIRDAAGLVTKAINGIFGTEFTAGQAAILASIVGLVGGFSLLASTIGAAVTAARLLFSLALANPWIAALTLLAAGVVYLATEQSSAAEAAQLHKKALDELDAAVAAVKAGVPGATEELDRLKEKHLQAARAALEDAKAQVQAKKEVLALVEQSADASALGPLERRMGFDINPAHENLVRAEINLAKAIRELQEVEDHASGNVKSNVEDLTKKAEGAATGIGKVGAAAVDTTGKIEDLGRAITVTSFGGSKGPVQQVYQVVDGVARAVDQTKAQLDGLDQSASNVGASIQNVASDVENAVRSVPEALQSDAASSAVDDVISDVERIAPATQQVASDVNTALADIGNLDASSAAQAADAILAPFRDLPSKIDEIMAGIRSASQNGFTSLIGIVRQLAGEIDAMITRIIAALRQAAAEAAKLRASGSSSSSSSRAPGHRLAGGGHLSHGPGTSTSDSIPAWLSLGEFVTQAKAVAYYGPGLFHALNKMLLPKDFLKGIRGFNLGGLADGIRSSLSSFSIPQFATGGIATAALAPAPAGGSGTPLVLQMPGGQMIGGITASDDAVSQLKRHAAGKAMTSAGRKPGWYR